jgi:hypothetical protein
MSRPNSRHLCSICSAALPCSLCLVLMSFVLRKQQFRKIAIRKHASPGKHYAVTKDYVILTRFMYRYDDVVLSGSVRMSRWILPTTHTTYGFR